LVTENGFYYKLKTNCITNKDILKHAAYYAFVLPIKIKFKPCCNYHFRGGGALPL